MPAVEAVNDTQKIVLSKRVVERFGGELSTHRFAVWGLAFKPNTDDMRDAPSVVLINDLLERGAEVHVYDPVATDAAKRVIGAHARLHYAANALEPLRDASALLIVTDWTPGT